MPNIFSIYAHPFEKKVNKFFKRITSYSRAKTVHKNLGFLMQKNLIVTNLWMERKYKNYTKLNKKNRAQLYANAQILGKQFDEYFATFRKDITQVQAAFQRFSLPFPTAKAEQLVYL